MAPELRPIRIATLSALVLTLAACQVGHSKGVCETDPAVCGSARDAALNGGKGSVTPLGPIAGQSGGRPPRTDAVALERGDVMRIWTAPYADRNGALHISGYTFVEMRQRQWDVSQVDFYWTAQGQ